MALDSIYTDLILEYSRSSHNEGAWSIPIVRNGDTTPAAAMILPWN